jgi:hypothetical protein
VWLLAKGRSVTRNLVVDGLIAKRAELAGIIADLERQLAQHRANQTHIDGVLRVLAADLNPEAIRPKRVYKRTRYFARNELSRLCLGVLRTAAGEPVTADFIAKQVIIAKGFARQIAFCADLSPTRSGRSSRLLREINWLGWEQDVRGILRLKG